MYFLFLVSLTKTNKKGLQQKQQVIEDIQECADKYPNIFLFSVDNMRNSTLKFIRTEWKDSRFFFGKNAIMKLGLQRAEIDEKFTNKLGGQKGLLFTTHDKDTVLDWFKEYSAEEFARSGFKATETVKLSEGPLEDFSHAIEPHLRKLGMPTKLDRGKVTLISPYTVCEKGQTLTPEQAKILKLVGRPLAKFRVNVECCNAKENGFELFIKEKEDKNSLKKSMKAKVKLLKAGKNAKSAKKNVEDGEETMETVEGSDDSDEEEDDSASDDSEMDDN